MERSFKIKVFENTFYTQMMRKYKELFILIFSGDFKVKLEEKDRIVLKYKIQKLQKLYVQ